MNDQRPDIVSAELNATSPDRVAPESLHVQMACGPASTNSQQRIDVRNFRARAVGRWASARAAAGLQRLRGNYCHCGFAILMYHRVAEPIPGVAPPTWNVAPERLKQQLSGLLERGFEAWPLRDIVKTCRARRSVPANVFAVTFDDGYANNYWHAWPILRELNIPATIYLATKYLDSERPFPFDDWPVAGSSCVPAESWLPLSARQCQQMQSGGLVDFGAHTHSHERFLGRPEVFRDDLASCLAALHDGFGVDEPTFAFPYGEFNAELVEIAMKIGVAKCLSTESRRVLPDEDSAPWGRFDVASNDSPAILAAKLSGWYTAVNEAGKTLVAGLPNLMPNTELSSHESRGSYERATKSGGRKALSHS
jgi:peptidoglycan/xylan/chitin deacetylase (PgdA/CDA1 family)